MTALVAAPAVALDLPAPGFAARAARLLTDANRFDLCLILTLMLLLLYPPSAWYAAIPLSVLALGALIFPWLRLSRWLWAAVGGLCLLGTSAQWYTADNHKYLLAYWCLAVALSLWSAEPDRTLAVTARRMLVLVFALAVVQKSLADDYLSGAFFHYELLMDQRFTWLAQHVGAVPRHMLDLNEAARLALINFDSPLPAVRLESTPRAASLALAITWWDYLVQVAIAAVYAWPCADRLGRTRDLWLLSFLAATYLFAPVIGFGWLLAILGLAQTDPGRLRTRAAFVAVFLLLQIYRMPWTQLGTN